MKGDAKRKKVCICVFFLKDRNQKKKKDKSRCIKMTTYKVKEEDGGNRDTI